MAQTTATNAKQYFNGTPGGEYMVIDAAPAANGMSAGLAGAPVSGTNGYDDSNIFGEVLAQSQGENVKPNGNVLIDSTNDFAAAATVNKAATVQGNNVYGGGTAQSPSQNAATVLQGAQVLQINVGAATGPRIVWKNPA